MLKTFCVFAGCLLLSMPITAQNPPSAEGPGISFRVGASISTFNPDYGCSSNSPFSCWSHQVIGISPYANTNFFLFGRIGAEGEARFLRWHGPIGLTETSYLFGPRVHLYGHRNIVISGKFMVGDARMHLPAPNIGTGTYFAYAPGADVDYRFSRRLSARVDYEYQRWPGFKSIQSGSGHGGLTPNGLSFGFSYAIP
jgi:opacity protein-like surface antigen